MIELVIPGNPIAKKRPRFVRRGGFVGTYNCQETEEGRWLWEVKSQWQGEPLTGPLEVEATFVMPIPKSVTKKTLAAIQAGQLHHIKKPDVDNTSKFFMDCLNGVAWNDDCQIVKLSASKEYGAQPRTIITIRPLGEVGN